MEDQTVCVAIFDKHDSRFGLLNDDIATTLVAVASEDPVDWAEMVAYWPRYTTRVVPEFASNIAIESSSREAAIAAIKKSDCWVVLDLIQKRFLSSESFQPITGDACFTMYTDENGKQHDPLSVHLAPWWEVLEQVDVAVVDQDRESPIVIPHIDRAILFGQPLIEDIANRVLAIANSDRGQQAYQWKDIDSRSNKNPFYPLTIEVHRDWLMTPRDDLDGLCPRQMLHGGRDWLEQVVSGHRLRFQDGGSPLVAIPKDVEGFLNGPIGSEEMVLYFDLCRELISAAWFWCRDSVKSIADTPQSSTVPPVDEQSLHLAEFLGQVKTDWLANPFEGGSPPEFMIECCRRRVPRGSGLEIVGMSERQAERHIIDCDCPICNMMADGSFGVSFSFIDGHHLELDDEFAFSMHQSREDWEDQQREYAEWSAQMDEKRQQRSDLTDGMTEAEADEFQSAWSSGNSPGTPFPSNLGGDNGDLRLAFLLAEVVSELQDHGAPDELVKQLNADFSAYRTSEPMDLSDNTKRLTETLESTAQQLPALVARVADFQSRLAERLRTPVANSKEDWDDLGF